MQHVGDFVMWPKQGKKETFSRSVTSSKSFNPLKGGTSLIDNQQANMIKSAAIISKAGKILLPSYIPDELKKDIRNHANTFLYTLDIEDDDVELPYLESTYLRYVYKQTDDLFWLLVTGTESNLISDVNLLGKFVCTIMEYGPSDINSSTITEEQKELFYRHIWRPWDEEPQCPTCGRYNNQSEIWEREFDTRVQFIINIRDGHVEEQDVKYFNGLVSESWAISAKLLNRAKEDTKSETDSLCSSETRSISEETVIDGCRLACRLEDIRLELKRLQDPYLRLFARRDLLVGSTFQQPATMSSAPSFDEIDSAIH